MSSDVALQDQVQQLRIDVDRLKRDPKDIWDIVAIIGAVLIPFTIALVGHWYTTAQDRANKELAAASAAVEQAKLVQSFLDAITGEDQRRQRIAVETLRFAVPKYSKTIRAGIHSGATAELMLALASADMEFTRLTREADSLIAESNEIFDPENDLTLPERLVKAKQLITTITTSFPEMITPASSVKLSHALQRIDAELAEIGPQEPAGIIDRAMILVFIKVHEKKVKDAIAEWESLKTAVSLFLTAAKKYETDPNSKPTLDDAFGKVTSAFLARIKATDEPPRLLRILEHRVYPAITLINVTRENGS